MAPRNSGLGSGIDPRVSGGTRVNEFDRWIGPSKRVSIVFFDLELNSNSLGTCAAAKNCRTCCHQTLYLKYLLFVFEFEVPGHLLGSSIHRF